MDISSESVLQWGFTVIPINTVHTVNFLISHIIAPRVFLTIMDTGVDNFKVSVCQRFKTYFTCRTTFVAQTGTAWLSVG